jgi:hypothetical protein
MVNRILRGDGLRWLRLVVQVPDRRVWAPAGQECNVMRSMVGFVSLLALGLMVAVALALAGQGLSANWSGLASRQPGGFRLDYPSLVLGLALGLVMATLARMSWAEMPRRIALWLLANERNFYRMAMAAACVGVLLFY